MSYRLYKRDQNPNSVWWVGIGRKIRCSTGTNDKAKAEEFAEALETNTWRRNRLGDRSAISFHDAAEKWLVSDATERKRDREFLPWLYQHVGNDPVSAVSDPDALEKLQALGLAEGLVAGRGWSHSTVDRMMTTVSAVLGYCHLKKWLTHPTKVPMFRPETDEPRWFTPGEYAALLRELPIHLELASRFAVLTLLRMSAMLQLTWDRVDLAGAYAWIPKAHQKMGRTFGFALSPPAIDVLRELRKLHPAGNRVFQYEGNPVRNCNTAAYRKAMARADIEGADWHTHRHTGATWAVKAGVSLRDLMMLGDWKSYASVLVYAHHAPQAGAESAARLGAQMSGGLLFQPTLPERAVDGGCCGDRTHDLGRVKTALLPTELSTRVVHPSHADTAAGAGGDVQNTLAVSDLASPAPTLEIGRVKATDAQQRPVNSESVAHRSHIAAGFDVGTSDQNSNPVIDLPATAAARASRLVRASDGKTINKLDPPKRSRKAGTGT